MINKPHIYFAMDTMLCGGIEKSLLSLLYALDPNKVKVTVCLDRRTGEFLSFIPNWVNVIDINYNSLTMAEKTLGRKKLIIKLGYKFKLLILIKLIKTIIKENKLTKDQRRINRAIRFYNTAKSDETIYDMAVAYANLEQHIYVSRYIKAKKKIAWFHTQIDTSREDFREYIHIMNSFDSLFCVSKALKDSFTKLVPELKDKVKLYPHIINVNMMKEWAKLYNAKWQCEDDTIKILSVGRLSYQKGFDMIPEIAHQLKYNGHKFIWIILGNGSEMIRLRNLVKEKNVEDCVIFKGVSLNPYPFFQTCDIYVQTSRYEGYCLTLAEARAFKKPIVSTKFDGSIEQLENGKSGLLVDCNVDHLYNAINKIITDNSLRNEIVENLKKQKVDSSDGVNILLNEINL